MSGATVKSSKVEVQMQVLEAELKQRWHEMFCALAAGDDVPPTQRLRAEGIMEAAVLLSIASPEALSQAMDRCYQAAFGRCLAEDFGDDWQEFFPFPQIPAMAKRAPVYPSTKD
jgi:hypothetical protein